MKMITRDRTCETCGGEDFDESWGHCLTCLDAEMPDPDSDPRVDEAVERDQAERHGHVWN